MTPTPHIRRAYTPLIQYTGWEDYYRHLSQEFGNLNQMYSSMANTFSTHPMAVQAVAQMCTESLSIVMTAIAALEASIPDIAERTSLEIHFVAASRRELSTRGMLEEIMHHFPRLRSLRVCYVGPELHPEEVAAQRPSLNHACSECKPKGSTRMWSLHPSEYHTFRASNPNRTPDLIVGINTGMIEVDAHSWNMTLRTIIAMKVPAVFTAYSRPEVMMEEMMFRQRAVDFVVAVHENKWRGVIPTVNPGITRDGGILGVYSSRFCYVVRGR